MKKRNIGVLIAGFFLAISMVGSTSCSCSKNQDTPPAPPVEEHVHTKSDWKSDETHHWHTCSGCDEILDKEAHSFGEWVVTKEATCTTPGEKTKTCSVCNYKIKEEIPMLGHKPKTTWDSDDTHHWHTCETCGEALEKAEHTFSEWVIEEEPTCIKAGKKSRTCSVCGHKVIEEIPINESAHEYGSYEVSVEPTKTTEGEIQIKCKLDETHIQKVVLPVLSSNIYQYRRADKDEFTLEEYYVFNLGNKEGVEALFAGTLLEGTTDLEDLITNSIFGKKTLCKHENVSASYEIIPSNTADGKLKFECLDCGESTMITLEPSSIKDYFFTPSDTEEGKGTYNLTLSAASRIYDSAKLATKFNSSKVNAVKAIKGAKFTASAYNLSIELVSELVNPTDKLKLKVFTPRNLNKPQFDIVEIDLMKNNTEWFEYRFTESEDCTIPVIKTLHIKESKLSSFATTYLDPVCGTISSHPETNTLLSNLVLATDTPTLSEQNAHSKHGFGNIGLIRKPSGDINGETGIVKIICDQYGKDAYAYELEIPPYSDSSFYDKIDDTYTTTYIVKESVLKSTIYNELKEHFNFTMDQTTINLFQSVIKIKANKNVTAELETPISDTRKTFTIGFFVDGVYEESITSTFSIDDTSYFLTSYLEKSCNELNVVYKLSDAGRNLYLENAGLESNPKIIDYLTNLTVGERTASDEVIHDIKTMHHQFVYLSHQLPTSTTETNGQLSVKCTSCNSVFTVLVSLDDIYTEGSYGDQVIYREGIEYKIQNTFKKLSLEEVRAFADIFVFGEYL